MKNKRILATMAATIATSLPAAAQDAGTYALREAAAPPLQQFAGGHGGEALLLLLLLPLMLVEWIFKLI